jgi:hypothetical protein
MNCSVANILKTDVYLFLEGADENHEKPQPVWPFLFRINAVPFGRHALDLYLKNTNRN